MQGGEISMYLIRFIAIFLLYVKEIYVYRRIALLKMFDARFDVYIPA